MNHRDLEKMIFSGDVSVVLEQRKTYKIVGEMEGDVQETLKKIEVTCDAR